MRNFQYVQPDTCLGISVHLELCNRRKVAIDHFSLVPYVKMMIILLLLDDRIILLRSFLNLLFAMAKHSGASVRDLHATVVVCGMVSMVVLNSVFCLSRESPQSCHIRELFQ